MGRRRGFTIVELMVVIIVVGVLAAVAIPFMLGHSDEAKWSEACTTTGLIRRAIRAYVAETSLDTAQGLIGRDLSDVTIQGTLGLDATDLEGTYFTAGDYAVAALNGSGIATITVTGGNKANAPTGSYQLEANGDWVKL